MRASHPLRLLPLVAALAGVLGTSACVTVQAAPLPPRPPPRVTVSVYEELAPYGEWIVVRGFGRVWRPWRHVVGIGFVPYSTGGHWEYGPWRKTVFHSGRWFHLSGEGWVWAPHPVWGPRRLR